MRLANFCPLKSNHGQHLTIIQGAASYRPVLLSINKNKFYHETILCI